MSKRRRIIREWRSAGTAALMPSLHLKPNAAWRARKRWTREHRIKPSLQPELSSAAPNAPGASWLARMKAEKLATGSQEKR